jgi:PAS domain S-box-containing protein
MSEPGRDPELSAAIEQSELLSTPDPRRVLRAARWGRVIAGAIALLWAAGTVDALLRGRMSGRLPLVLGPFPLATSLGLALLGLILVIRATDTRPLMVWSRLALASGVLLLTVFAVMEALVSPGRITGYRDLAGPAAEGVPLLLLICMSLLALAALSILAHHTGPAQWLALVPLAVGIVLSNALLFDPRALSEITLAGQMSVLGPPTLAALSLSVLMQTSSEGFVALGMANDDSSRTLRRNLPLGLIALEASMFLGLATYEVGFTSRGLAFGLGTGLIIFIGGIVVWAQTSRFHKLDMRRQGAENVMARSRRALAERDTMAQRLGASQQRLQHVLDTSIDAYVSVDGSGLVTEWNLAATRMFGWTYSEAVNTPLDRLVVPEDQREGHRAAINRFLEAGQDAVSDHPTELVAMRKDKSTVEVEIRVWPTRESGGTHLHAFIRDITERRRNQAELLRANRELEEFAAVAAHDLRSPLVAITLTAEMIAQQEAESHSDATVEWAHRILEATRRGSELIDELIALSQVSSSQRRAATVHLEPLAREIAEEVAVRGSRPGTVEVGTLPDISGDEILIRQLFHNLIANSFKYVPEDREPVVTISGLALPDGGTHITIRDNGDGIPDGDLPRVFDMFHRGANTHDSAGSGIGLAICRRVVERHGGSIWASNPSEGGARFDLTLRSPQATGEG